MGISNIEADQAGVVVAKRHECSVGSHFCCQPPTLAVCKYDDVDLLQRERQCSEIGSATQSATDLSHMAPINTSLPKAAIQLMQHLQAAPRSGGTPS